MKIEIKTLDHLRLVISALTEEQLSQPTRVLKLDGEESNRISALEITEEPFLQSKGHPESVGYPEEMRREFGTCDPELFTILEPVGTIYLHASKGSDV